MGELDSNLYSPHRAAEQKARDDDGQELSEGHHRRERDGAEAKDGVRDRKLRHARRDAEHEDIRHNRKIGLESGYIG